MREVGALEAKETLGSLLDLVQDGEEVVITRNGIRVARLVRDVEPTDRRERARRAGEAIGRLSMGVTLGGIPLKALVDDGRP